MFAGTSQSRFWMYVVSITCSQLFASADQENIKAQPGEHVTLPCRAPNSNNILGVDWSRADLKEQYVLLFRDGRSDADNQHPSFKNRVNLQDTQMKDGDVSLILKNVTIADSGTYECRIKTSTNRRKRAVYDSKPISSTNLVVGPPGPTGGSAGLRAGRSVSAVLLVAALIVL